MNYILKKIVKYAIIIVALILIFNIINSVFLTARCKNIDDFVETMESGTIENNVPVIVREFEKKLEYSNKSEILEHYEVRGKGEDDNLYGYVQVWKTQEPLEHYLNLCKEYMSLNVYGFTETDVTVNSIKWRKWEYIVNGISAAQAFCKIGDKIYMCSLFVSYQERTYAFDKIFIELMESISE